MQTRKLIVWLFVISAGGGVALAGGAASAFLFEDLSALIDYAKALAVGLVIISSAVGGWIIKRRLRRRMVRGLGRDVDDIELLSINRWMLIPDEARRAAIEEDNVFND